MARRKRNDPGDAPIDGDLRRDKTVNQEKGYRYLLLNDRDATIWGEWGAEKTQRREGGPRPAFADASSEASGGYTVGGGALTHYRIPEARYLARHKAAQDEGNSRMAVIKRETRARGGELTETTV